MKIAPDTNVLIRVLMADDPRQTRVAQDALREATAICLALPCLCELVWVLRRVYRRSAVETARALRHLLDLRKAECNRPAVEAGLAMLEAGGDFADGVIAYEGRWMGAERFVSLDREAVSHLRAQGVEAVVL